MSRKRRPPPPPQGVLAGWTIQRATVAGIAFGLLALLVSAFVAGPALLYLHAGLLALTLFCGLSVLWITLHDIRTRGRGGRMRPIRAFDLLAGGLLVLAAGYGLHLAWPALGL